MDFFHIYSIYVLPEGTCTPPGPAIAWPCHVPRAGSPARDVPPSWEGALIPRTFQ